MTTRYRLRPMVYEWEGESLWTGPLPDGPIMRLDGGAQSILAALGDEEDARVPLSAGLSRWRTLDEIVAHLRETVAELPEDVDGVAQEFLRSLEEGGLVDIDDA